MTSDKDRYCAKHEIWVCPHCGKHVECDRFFFDDESCMINAIKVKEADCTYKDDNKNMRVIAVGVEPDGD